MQRPSDRTSRRRGNVCIFDLAENLGFADQHRVESGADPEEMIDGLVTESRIKVRLQVVTGCAVTKVREKRLDLRDAGFVVVELGVDLQAAAGLQHDRFLDRFVIPQRDQRLGHPRGRERVALADLDRGRVVRKTDAGQGHTGILRPRGAARQGHFEHLAQRGVACGDRQIDIGGRMSAREKVCFVRGGGEVDPAVEHRRVVA